MTPTKSRTARKRESCPALLVIWLLLGFLFCRVGITYAVAESTRVLLAEDFEGYTNTESMVAVWRLGTAELVDVLGGGKAASHDGGEMNVKGGFSVRPSSTERVVFSADLYDYATNADKRVSVILRNNGGARLEFGYLNKIGYAARLVGLTTETNWISFDPLVLPRKGWHRFEATMSMTNIVVTLDLGADGTVDKTLTFESAAQDRPFAEIRFGGLARRKSIGGPMLVDNIRLAVVTGTNLVVAASASPSEKSSQSNTQLAKLPLPPMELRPPTKVTSSPTPPLPEPVLPTAPVEPAPEKPSVATPIPTPIPPVVASAPPAPSPAPTLSPQNVSPQKYDIQGMNGQALWWIVGGLGIVIVLLIALLLALRRSPPAASHALIPLSAVNDTKTLQDKMLPELTEFAKQRLVQGLYSQRNALIDTQKRAQEALVELEARLASLHLPLIERIHVYEKQIGELEKQLETRNEEMRELTQATLLLVKEKLAKERERAGERFN